MARLGEVAWKMLGGLGSAISQADVVTVIEFVGASHYEQDDQLCLRQDSTEPAGKPRNTGPQADCSIEESDYLLMIARYIG